MGLTTTKYFRWDDPGALKLDGTAGSFYSIIKHCLTEAGWSIAFDDPGNFKIVLRNSLAHGGSGGYLRVQDDASFTGGGRVALVEAFESMTDIDTGSNRGGWCWPWKARESGGAVGADAVPRCYVISADERTVYMSMWVGDDNLTPRGAALPPVSSTGSNAGNLSNFWYAGDLENRIPGDLSIFCGGQQEQQNPAQHTGANVSSLAMQASVANAQAFSSSQTCMSRNASNSPAETKVSPMAMGAIAGAIGSITSDNDAVDILFAPVYVCAEGKIRGRMRGVYQPLTNIATAGICHLGTEIQPATTEGGLNLVTMVGNNCRFFVETAKSWDDLT